MKIPNWKTWPDQVFTLPAGLATGWFLAGYIDDPLSSGPFPLRLTVLAGFLCLCTAPGALVAALLDWLRRPGVGGAAAQSFADVKAAARQEGPLPVAPFSRAEGGMLVLVSAWCGAVLALALGSFAWLFVAKVLQGTVLACAGASLAAVCLVAAGDLALGVWVVRRTRDR